MSEYICLEMFQYLKKRKIQEETGKKCNDMKKNVGNRKKQEDTERNGRGEVTKI